jgi:hypothetical protein
MNRRPTANRFFPSCALGLVLFASLLRAGSVTSLSNKATQTGKLTLSTTAVHVDGPAAADVDLPDILEADFTDLPFDVNFFSTTASGVTRLPASWQALQVGPATSAGTASFADGTITMSGDGSDAKTKIDSYFFIGQPWTGSGQWTARITQGDSQNPLTEIGLMLRNGLDAGSGQLHLGVAAQKGRKVDGPQVFFQADNGVQGKGTSRAHSKPVSVQFPVWIRLTRCGNNIDASLSTDGKQWDVVSQYTAKNWDTTSIGLFVDSHVAGTVAKAVIDNVTFTPVPGLSQILPAGVLLRSGSFLAGTLEHLDLTPMARQAKTNFRGSEKPFPVPADKIAVAVLLPTQRSQITDANSQPSLIMRNGDFLQGTPVSIGGNAVRMNSDLLGNVTYTPVETRACILASMAPLPAAYEIRLKDGSLIRANDLGMNNGQIVINEVSGIPITVDQEEIAQFRAGPTQAESLIDLPWKATPPATAPLSVPAPPATNAAPAPNVPAPETPTVLCWEGNNQEQILAAPAGTSVDFPLTGKSRELAMRIAVSPDSPPNSTAVIRILADGREIGRTPALKQGEQPRFLQITIQSPKDISFAADSPNTGTQVLFIDPVVLR